MVTGYTPIKGGHGSLIIPGDGRLFIMAAGILIRITGLSGFPTVNGDRVGLPGEDQEDITDGLRLDLVSACQWLTAMNTLYRTINGDLYGTVISEEGTSITTMSITQTMLQSSIIQQ